MHIPIAAKALQLKPGSVGSTSGALHLVTLTASPTSDLCGAQAKVRLENAAGTKALR